MTNRTDESLAVIAAELRRMNRLMAIKIMADAKESANISMKELVELGDNVDKIMED